MSSTASAPARAGVRPAFRWRTQDIVVAAVIAAALSLVMVALNWGWASVGAGAGSPFNVLYGGWLLPAVVAPAIVRKPGAALFAEMVAASLSVLLVNQWGQDALLSGFLQGLGAEVVFAIFRYRRFDLLVLVLASVASAAMAFVHDATISYQGTDAGPLAVTFAWMLVSAIVLMPLVTIAIVRALRRAGALRGFPA